MQSWIKGAIGVLMFFGIIVGYSIQVDHFSGHLDLAGLIKAGIITGLIIGILSGQFLYKKGKDQDAKFSIYAGMLVLGIVTGPLILSLANRAFSGSPETTKFQLIKIDPVIQSSVGILVGHEPEPNANIVTMKKEGVTYEVKLGPELDGYLIDDESIILNIRKGGLGYNYIDNRPTTGRL